ncbi:unnamed protein product, partial [Callosobruchus maculatus]
SYIRLRNNNIITKFIHINRIPQHRFNVLIVILIITVYYTIIYSCINGIS